MINFTDIRDGVSRSVNPHLGASAKAINNATRKIYDGNFICNFRAVKDLHSTGRKEKTVPSARPRPSARNARMHAPGCQTFRGRICRQAGEEEEEEEESQAAFLCKV